MELRAQVLHAAAGRFAYSIWETHMRLHGSTEGNLLNALRSANRLRGHHIHADTLQFWSDLVVHAKREISSGGELRSSDVARLAAQLETEVTGHSASLRQTGTIRP